MAKSKYAKRLTPDEIDRIVELRLNRISYRAIAEQMGCDKATAMLHWHKWLDDCDADRRANLERRRTEVIERLDSAAATARQGAIRARSQLDPIEAAKAEARFLAEERQALLGLSKVAGYDAPMRVGVAWVPEMTDAEAAEILANLPE